MEKTILIVNGSYRSDGITDQMLAVVAEQLEQSEFTVSEIKLRDIPIAFCTNCRTCMQQKGTAPGTCVIADDMQHILQQLELADGYVFASPTNFGTVTAIFKRFLERLAVYGYWPWKTHAPTYRKPETKPALCLSSCAAPSLIGRLAYGTLGVMKQAAKCTGARVIETMMLGLSAQDAASRIDAKDRQCLVRITRKLIRKAT